MTREEIAKTARQAENLKTECENLRKELDNAIEQLKIVREKLVEAQERNRKLDWLLTKAVEGL